MGISRQYDKSDIDIQHTNSRLGADVRVAGQKRKRTSIGEPQWTAARCSRLLRTIDCRIAALQRLLKNGAKECESSLGKRKTSSKHTSEKEFSNEEDGAEAVDTQHSDDPDWLPVPKVRTLQKDYSGKNRTTKPSTTDRKDSADQTGFTTPFLRRVLLPDPNDRSREESCTDADTARVDRGKQDQKHPKTKKSRQVHTIPSSAILEAQEGLVSAFSSVLAATKPKSEEIRVGCRSLTSLCLRNIPAFVKCENSYLAQFDDDVKIDVTHEVYTELENFGGRSGWTALRELVRAHCVDKIRDNILAGVISPKLAGRLVGACSDAGASAEGQRLLETLVLQTTMTEDPIPVDNNTRDLVRNIRRFAEESSSSEWELRAISMLIESPKDFSSFLSTGDVAMYTRMAVEQLSGSRNFDAGAMFVESLIHHLLLAQGSPQISKRSQIKSHARTVHHARIVHHALVLVSAMAITCSSARCAQLLVNIHCNIEQHVNLHPPAVNSSTVRYLLDAARLSTMILHAMGFVPSPYLVHFDLAWIVERIDSANTGKPTRLRAHRLIGDVAKCVGRFDTDKGREIWEDMIKALISACQLVSGRHAHVLQRLALENAEDLSMILDENSSVDIVRQVEMEIEQRTNDLAATTPASCTKSRGYRWDAGLSEFIANTPFPERSRQKGISQRKRRVSVLSHVAITRLHTPLRVRQVLNDVPPNAVWQLRSPPPEQHLSQSEETGPLVTIGNERDELGIPTPDVRKKRRVESNAKQTSKGKPSLHTMARPIRRRPVRRPYMSVQMAGICGNSDDELCI